MYPFILASASPRRKQLLGLICPSFEIVTPNIAETVDPTLAVADIPAALAKQKGERVFSQHPQTAVISADTIVCIDNQILGKPKDKRQAFAMLTRLSGRAHTVYTGVSVLSPVGDSHFTSETTVLFHPLTDDIIKDYIKTNDPMDKAGAYGIQGVGSLLVKEIRGDFYNVMGLPVSQLARVLKNMGLISKFFI